MIARVGIGRSIRGRGLLAGAALAAATGALLLSACAKYEPYPVCDFRELSNPSDEQVLAGPALLPQTPGAMRPMPLNTVNVTDRNIVRKVMVQSANARRTETNSVQVATMLVNCTDHPLQVEGRTHFFDAGYAETEAPSAWRRIYLPPRTVATYSERSAGTNGISTYLVELREGR